MTTIYDDVAVTALQYGTFTGATETHDLKVADKDWKNNGNMTGQKDGLSTGTGEMADLIKTSKVLRLNFDCSVAYGVFDKQCVG